MGCTDLLKCIDRTFAKSIRLPLDRVATSEFGSFPLQAVFVYRVLVG